MEDNTKEELFSKYFPDIQKKETHNAELFKEYVLNSQVPKRKIQDDDNISNITAQLQDTLEGVFKNQLEPRLFHKVKEYFEDYNEIRQENKKLRVLLDVVYRNNKNDFLKYPPHPPSIAIKDPECVSHEDYIKNATHYSGYRVLYDQIDDKENSLNYIDYQKLKAHAYLEAVRNGGEGFLKESNNFHEFYLMAMMATDLVTLEWTNEAEKLNITLHQYINEHK